MYYTPAPAALCRNRIQNVNCRRAGGDTTQCQQNDKCMTDDERARCMKNELRLHFVGVKRKTIQYLWTINCSWSIPTRVFQR